MAPDALSLTNVHTFYGDTARTACSVGSRCGRSRAHRCGAWTPNKNVQLENGEPLNVDRRASCILQAEALSMVEGHAGAVAFSRTGDPGAGKFKDATVLKKFGDVPDDLSAL